MVVYSGFKGVSVTKAAADEAIITATAAAVTTPTVSRVIYIARNRVRRAPLKHPYGHGFKDGKTSA